MILQYSVGKRDRGNLFQCEIVLMSRVLNQSVDIVKKIILQHESV